MDALQHLKHLLSARDGRASPEIVAPVVQALLASGVTPETIAVEAGLTMQDIRLMTADNSTPTRGWSFPVP